LERPLHLTIQERPLCNSNLPSKQAVGGTILDAFVGIANKRAVRPRILPPSTPSATPSSRPSSDPSSIGGIIFHTGVVGIANKRAFQPTTNHLPSKQAIGGTRLDAVVRSVVHFAVGGTTILRVVVESVIRRNSARQQSTEGKPSAAPISRRIIF
jgi:hypothetical protein